LELADVHAVVAYYLRHREEVRAYLKRRHKEAEALRAKIETERPRLSRKELISRRRVRRDHPRRAPPCRHVTHSHSNSARSGQSN
jgi:hypothetical protein